MSKLIVVSFSDDASIDEAIRALKKMQEERSIRLNASAIVARDTDGKLRAQVITHERHGATAIGALIGGLAGLPAGPLGAAIGAAGGALIGGSAEFINQRADSECADRISRELMPGKSAVVADVDEDGAAAFEARMQAIGGAVQRQ